MCSNASEIYKTLKSRVSCQDAGNAAHKEREMRFHSFLIKYGEIGIKGKNRYLFEDALVRQMRFALKGVDGEF